MAGVRLARIVIAAASLLVPRRRRAEWREEWEAELAELMRRAERVPARYGSASRAALRYVSGAYRHAWWELRQEWTMDRLRQDVRYAARTLRRSPAFSTIAVVTLALGVGANATVFSMVNRLLFRAPPGVEAPERLVQIGRHEEPERFDNWPWPAYRVMAERSGGLFEDVAGYAAAGVVLGRGADARAASAHLVSGGYFRALGLEPVLGRRFTAEEADGREAAPVAVISHATWQRDFGGERGVIGRRVLVDGRPYEIVGVAPEGFAGVDVFRVGADVFLPLAARSALAGASGDAWDEWGRSWVWVVARLAPGVSPDRAVGATRARAARLAREHPEMGATGGQLVEGVGTRPAERAEARLLSALLLGLTALVLLIACANLAGLALARGVERRREIGVRLALGARRGQVVRQLLVESLLLGVAGGAVAVGVALLAARGLGSVLPASVSVALDPDARVLGITLLTGLCAGVGFGALPAATASRPDLIDALRKTAGAGGRGGRGATRIGRALVVGQVALSFVLVAATALLVESVRNVRAADPGFDPDRAFVVTLDPAAAAGLDPTSWERLPREAAARIAELRGVEAVGAAAVLPIVDPQPNRTAVDVAGSSPDDGPAPLPVFTNAVGPGYFEAMGIPLLRGRGFRGVDMSSGRPAAAVVSQRFVERFFPGEDAIGRPLPFAMAPDGVRPTIVGVVADHRTRGLAEPPVATLFTPLAADEPGRVNLIVRTRANAADAAASVLAAAERVDAAGVPVVRAAPLRELVVASHRSTRLTLRIAAATGLLALALAAVGVHGLLAYTIARRRTELGIRIALGASTTDVLTLVLRQTVGLITVGLALGIALAVGVLRSLSGLLYGVRPTEPWPLAAMAMLLVLVGLAASLGPARRAVRTDPARTLQEM